MILSYKFTKAFLLLFWVFTFICKGQTKQVYSPNSGDLVTIFSKVLNEDRRIYIHYPTPDSGQVNKSYPVLYVMDGESHFDMLSQYTDYLSRWDVKVIPQMIVVGIVNTKRTRDLTPTSSIIDYFGKPDTSAHSWMKPSGGNEAFLQFIRKELMPYVDTHYQTQPFKLFAGHSFGGIASIYCMITHPDMFNAYIAISPSFWWDREYVLKLADKKLKKAAVLNKTLFYSDASEGVTDSSSFHVNLLKFDALLKTKALKEFTYTYKYYPTETHMTEPIVAYYDALRFIYKDWKSTSAK
ncbi:alpha/beta hydrolase-fold protein [Cytophagaceae bacterium YF14B1]|uniref:Alpha/beta hydrolase-fold protein n=1 Tax=Xanthocytophaga flava TaxID=3048013 RepID=A0AAE3QUB4_9BACT|nr:alpha/beta hydrolase-fold protein [Xanthocytophaga flavus]MDJ1482768.1 alpha/beta hydrolase-fold protein [Xanthocytophaga flavus]